MWGDGRARRRGYIERASVSRRGGSRAQGRIDEIRKARGLVDPRYLERWKAQQVDRSLGDAGVAAPTAVDAGLDVAAEDQQRNRRPERVQLTVSSRGCGSARFR
jgi:hypothetical protein